MERVQLFVLTMYFTHLYNDIYWWRSVSSHYTIKDIVHWRGSTSRIVWICNISSLH